MHGQVWPHGYRKFKATVTWSRSYPASGRSKGFWAKCGEKSPASVGFWRRSFCPRLRVAWAWMTNLFEFWRHTASRGKRSKLLESNQQLCLRTRTKLSPVGRGAAGCCIFVQGKATSFENHRSVGPAILWLPTNQKDVQKQTEFNSVLTTRYQQKKTQVT
jgi:hypothetical protein